jgi:hypothetical protein
MFNACDFVGVDKLLQVSVDKLLQDMRRTTTPAAPAAVDKIHLLEEFQSVGTVGSGLRTSSTPSTSPRR